MAAATTKKRAEPAEPLLSTVHISAIALCLIDGLCIYRRCLGSFLEVEQGRGCTL